MVSFTEKAQKKLQQLSYKITDARSDVIEVLANNDQALTAYNIQGLLKQSRKEYQVITIYRVLDLLCELEIIHKIYSINAYIKCTQSKGHDHHHHQFLVCEKCHQIKKIDNNLTCAVVNRGFIAKQDIHEILGLCSSCH